MPPLRLNLCKKWRKLHIQDVFNAAWYALAASEHYPAICQQRHRAPLPHTCRHIIFQLKVDMEKDIETILPHVRALYNTMWELSRTGADAVKANYNNAEQNICHILFCCVFLYFFWQNETKSLIMYLGMVVDHGIVSMCFTFHPAFAGVLHVFGGVGRHICVSQQNFWCGARRIWSSRNWTEIREDFNQFLD